MACQQQRNKMIKRNNFITFIQKNHTYNGLDGRMYFSMSKVKKEVVPPFDPKVAYYVAKKEFREQGIEATEPMLITRQGEILQEWNNLAEEAADHGTLVHEANEYIGQGKPLPAHIIEKIGPNGEKTLRDLEAWLQGRNPFVYFNEFIVHSKKYCTAGTIDRLQVRQRTMESAVDLYDYKSNLQGMTFWSSKLNPDNTVKKHYRRYFQEPLDHLEHSKWMEAVIQLSGYAFMLEEMTEMKIGQLGMLEILPDFTDWNIHYIPYLKMEMIALFDTFGANHGTIVNARQKMKIEFNQEDF